MPYIICVIDEFPRLYSEISNKEYANEIEAAMNELLSSGRHANIHLVLAAQDPVKANIKGSIANITARMAFKCAHYQNSITILGRKGAEKLLGRGQMIFDCISGNDRVLQGSYISSKDMKILLNEIGRTFKQQNMYPFKINISDANLNSTGENGRIAEFSQCLRRQSSIEKLTEAIMWSLPQSGIANSRLQTQLHIGNNRANELLSRMEEMGLIRRLNGNRGWETLPRCFEDIHPEVVAYLKENGVTESEIRGAFPKNQQATNA